MKIKLTIIAVLMLVFTGLSVKSASAAFCPTSNPATGVGCTLDNYNYFCNGACQLNSLVPSCGTWTPTPVIAPNYATTTTTGLRGVSTAACTAADACGVCTTCGGSYPNVCGTYPSKFCKANFTPTSGDTGYVANCSDYNDCTEKCSSCAGGYALCSAQNKCTQIISCLPGQTFNSCTGVCEGSAAILKLGADSVSGTNIIQSASASYSTLFIPQLNRVGIGTSTPSTFLQFGGSGQTINMSGTRIGGLDLTPLTADEAVPLGYLQANYAPVSSAFWTGTSTGHIYNTNTGNIGIGTTNPTQKLDVVGSFRLSGSFFASSDGAKSFFVDRYSTNSYSDEFAFRKGRGTELSPLLVSLGDELGGVEFHGYNGSGFTSSAMIRGYVDGTTSAGNVPGRLSFFVNSGTQAGYGTESLTIKSNGNVGIGTTNPLYKLDVNGSIQGSDIYNKGTVLRRSPYEYYGSVDVSSNLNDVNNTAYINLGTFSDGFTHINVEVELVPWLLNTSNIGSYKKAYVLRITSASPGVVSIYDSRVMGDIGPTGNKYQIGVPEADGSNNLRIPIKYIGSGSGNSIRAFVRVTGSSSSNIDKVSLSVAAPSAVSAGTQEFMSFRNRLGIGTTVPQNNLDVSGNVAIGSYSGVNAAPSNSLIVSGNVGIGTTNPTAKLYLNGGSGIVQNVGGGRISGLDLTPLASTDAVPLGYLQANYSASSSSLWSGTKNGNIWNGDSGAGNVGIGTSSPLAKLEIIDTSANGLRLTYNATNYVKLNTDSVGSLVITPTGTANTGYVDIKQVHPYYGFLMHKGSGWGGQGLYGANNDFGISVGATTQDIVFNGGNFQAANEIMRLKGTGNVGIGTTNPTEKLTVSNGNFRVNATANRSFIMRSNSGSEFTITAPTTDAAWLQFQNAGDVYAIGVDNNDGALKFKSGWYGGTNERMRLTSSGNVGIGTTNPTAKLHLWSSGTQPNLFRLSSDYHTNFVLENSSANDFYTLMAGTGGSGIKISDSNWFFIGHDSYANRDNTSGGTIRFVVGTTGNVGIGTTTPSTKLQVNGGSGQAINVSGGRIGGLDLTPLSSDEAVPLGYLQANYFTAASSTAGITSIFLTATTYNGSFINSTYTGYDAGNKICAALVSDSHFCRTDEVVYLIQKNGAVGFSGINGDNAWIADGPPGFTGAVAADDCGGWTDATNNKLGHFWMFSSSGGGRGSLSSCDTMKKIACCK